MVTDYERPLGKRLAAVAEAAENTADVYADRGVQRLHDQIRSGGIYNDGVLLRHDDLFDDLLCPGKPRLPLSVHLADAQKGLRDPKTAVGLGVFAGCGGAVVRFDFPDDAIRS